MTGPTGDEPRSINDRWADADKHEATDIKLPDAMIDAAEAAEHPETEDIR